MSGSNNGSGSLADWSGHYNYFSGNGTDRQTTWLKAASNTFVYVLPAIIVGGIVGNVLSMVIFCSRHFRHAPCVVLLFALAVVDTLTLSLIGGISWMEAMFPATFTEFKIQQSRLYCFVLLGYSVVGAMSPWTVVLIALERFVSVMWPFRAGTICSKKKMVISWFVVLLIIILIYSCIYLIAVDANCEASYTTLLHLEWTNCVVMGVGPFVLIVPGNPGIIYTTCVASHKRTTTVDTSSSAAASAASDAKSITIMLVAVCVVFLVTVYPYYAIFFVMEYYANNSRLRGVFLFSAILYSINSATNFILYFSTGKLFRRAFLQVMCRCKRHNMQLGLQRGNNLVEVGV